MIKIHYDFTDKTEISYKEGLEKKDNFTTNCLDFFSLDFGASEVIIIDKEGNYISRNNIQAHTKKEIRKEHNILKMFKAGAFKWEKEKA